MFETDKNGRKLYNTIQASRKTELDKYFIELILKNEKKLDFFFKKIPPNLRVGTKQQRRALMLISGWKPAINLQQAPLPWPHQPARKWQNSQIPRTKKD